MNCLHAIRRLAASFCLLAWVACAMAYGQSAPATPTSNNPFNFNPASSPAAAPAISTGTADIHNIHGIVPLTFWERNGVLIIGSSAAAIVLITTILVLVLRKKPVKPFTAYEIALHKLAYAKSQAGDGKDKVFAIAASDAVRHYLENAYRMPAPERTTEEFLQEAARLDWLRGELEVKLRRFLEFCDLAKFAGQQFGESERQQLLNAACEFVDAAEKLRQASVAKATTTAAKPVPATTPPKLNPAAKPTIST